jgi:hypothetical protein
VTPDERRYALSLALLHRCMKYRKLRIACSVGWGVVAVLLIMLWLRSYWWENAITFRMAGRVVTADSAPNGLPKRTGKSTVSRT